MQNSPYAYRPLHLHGMNRVKDLMYTIIGRLAAIGPRRIAAGKKMLILRLDEIGDYMLWHKFLGELAKAPRFKGYEVHFLGNQSWKSLFNTFDAEFAKEILWLDKIRFKKDMPYRYRLLKQLYKERYEVVINPTFSRDKRYDDSVVRTAKATETFGMVANLESTRVYETGYDKGLYTHIFNHPGRPLFEFFRNKLFTEFVTGKRSTVADTQVARHRLPSFPIDLPGKYFIVFPGSRSKSRIWPTEHFVRVSNYLFDTHGWTAVVCGTPSDEAYTRSFCEQYLHPTLDLTGKTSLVEMLAVFTRAQCLLSVDTGSVHLAAAVGCTVFGVFNGSQYGRFAPYPKQVSPNFYAVYPDEIEQEVQDAQLVKDKYEFVVKVPYSLVKPEKVIHVIVGR
ncbi:MAG: ADP-heptose:LPS heptosyltransferase [Sediminibacterium sp.]|nr:ADP-heptose:LPS heptosyltransferase [Sediminibacterium sp.]